MTRLQRAIMAKIHFGMETCQSLADDLGEPAKAVSNALRGLAVRKILIAKRYHHVTRLVLYKRDRRKH